MPHAHPARQAIASLIRAGGPISFARYMELALYLPDGGFYSCGHSRVGRRGDFLTSVSHGPAMGCVLATQFAEMWEVLGRPNPFVVVEQGANDARLARDLLNAVRPPFAHALHYQIIEPFRPLQDKQKETLAGVKRPVRWQLSLEETPPFTGIHFSNELVDALPFHLVLAVKGGWKELFVDIVEGEFQFAPGVLSESVSSEIHNLPLRPEGTLAEVRPAAREWIEAVSQKLKSGFLLTIDYGLERDQLYAPSRPRGTFACFQSHHRDEMPLENPGEKDITAHVDFTALEEAGRKHGLSFVGLCDQTRFLMGAAEPLLREIEGQPDAPIWRGLKPLMHPDSMGKKFQVLCLSTPLPQPVALSGFRHARRTARSDASF